MNVIVADLSSDSVFHLSFQHTLMGPDVLLKVTAVLHEVGVTVRALLCTLHHRSCTSNRYFICQTHINKKQNHETTDWLLHNENEENLTSHNFFKGNI